MVADTGKGKHYVFEYPKVGTVKSRSRVDKTPFDYRGRGGYFVAAPSRHASGKQYVWANSPANTPIAVAPDWLVGMATSTNRPAKVAGGGAAGGDSYDGNDLESHPGVAEGGRHDAAVQLIGRELGRGTEPLDVMDRALVWAGRCKPPMEAREVVRIVRDFAAKDVERFEESLLTAPAKPPRLELGNAAYHGPIGEAVQLIAPHTEADPVGILFQTLAIFGNESGRGAYVQVNATRHYPLVWGVTVGGTAKARKGTAGDIAKAIFGEALSARVWSGLSSGEGLVKRIADELVVMRPARGAKSGGPSLERHVLHSGVADKRLLVMEDEFGQTLQVIRRDGNTLSALLRKGWDGSRVLNIGTGALRLAMLAVDVCRWADG